MRASLKETILKATVTLFSERGYNAVSMRDIAKLAGANVGSITYHFGSKSNLLREVYQLHAEPMNARRRELLGEAQRIKDGDERLLAVLRAYILPAFVSSTQSDGGGAEFTRMRAILSAEGNEDAREIIADAFDETSRTFIEAIADCVPLASKQGLVWRSQFLLGSLYYALINPDRITRLSGGEVDGADHHAAINELVETSFVSFKSLSRSSGENVKGEADG
jgi:AcrR family transcriptional regulator